MAAKCFGVSQSTAAISIAANPQTARSRTGRLCAGKWVESIRSWFGGAPEGQGVVGGRHAWFISFAYARGNGRGACVRGLVNRRWEQRLGWPGCGGWNKKERRCVSPFGRGVATRLGSLRGVGAAQTFPLITAVAIAAGLDFDPVKIALATLLVEATARHFTANGLMSAFAVHGLFLLPASCRPRGDKCILRRMRPGYTRFF